MNGKLAPAEHRAPFFSEGENIRLTGEGVWIADGIEITHEQTRSLFAKSLRKDEQGWYLQVGYEAKRIVIEDTPAFIHRIDGTPASGPELWVSDESRQKLDPTTLHYRPGRLTCRVRLASAGAEVEARFLRAAYFDLLRHLEEDERSYFLRFPGGRVELSAKGR